MSDPQMEKVPTDHGEEQQGGLDDAGEDQDAEEFDEAGEEGDDAGGEEGGEGGEQSEGSDQEPADSPGEGADEGQQPADAGEDESEDPDRAFRGVRADLQGERTRRQVAEQRAAEAEAKITELQGRTPAPHAPEQPPDPLAELADDDLVTAGQVRELLATKSATDARTQFDSRAEASEQRMIAETTEAKVGPGLDYNTVLEVGARNLTRGDYDAIFNSKDPAKEGYRRAILCTPELQDRRDEFLRASAIGILTAGKKAPARKREKATRTKETPPPEEAPARASGPGSSVVNFLTGRDQ